VPQEIFWRNLAEECVDLGVGVNLWLFPAEYVDVASLSKSSYFVRKTPGQLLIKTGLLLGSCRYSSESEWRRSDLHPQVRPCPSRRKAPSYNGGFDSSRDGLQRYNANPMLDRFVASLHSPFLFVYCPSVALLKFDPTLLTSSHFFPLQVFAQPTPLAPSTNAP
jgi:hypothetical protein